MRRKPAKERRPDLPKTDLGCVLDEVWQAQTPPRDFVERVLAKVAGPPVANSADLCPLPDTGRGDDDAADNPKKRPP
jgi:hypothetical protein